MPETTTATTDGAFRFGRNWQHYVDTYLDSDRERIAAESLLSLTGDLAGKRFLDIGCGSGLFSLCALRAGAREVVSLDIDPDSVSATYALRASAGSPENWTVLHRSILDRKFVDGMAPADVVYSWGVLHHTGDMYRAILNAASVVRPGGRFVIAIYNRVSGGRLTNHRWWQIKRTYNRAPRLLQSAMVTIYALYWGLGRLRNRENPLRLARDYRHSRGMALTTDLVDWLGGYPYEFATSDEIVQFCVSEVGLELVEVRPVADPQRDTGNNEFIFATPLA